MKTEDLLNILDISDLRLMPEALMDIVLSSPTQRNKVYQELLALNNNNLSYDWFNSLYEDELAQRSQNKQDFTPNMVGVLLSKLTGEQAGKIYESTAGNGSLLIANWWHRVNALGSLFKPSQHPVECWELSDRSMPILLFNLSIRGINAEVYHGDVLNQIIKAKYTLQNVSDSLQQFSEITKK